MKDYIGQDLNVGDYVLARCDDNYAIEHGDFALGRIVENLDGLSCHVDFTICYDSKIAQKETPFNYDGLVKIPEENAKNMIVKYRLKRV